MKEVVTFLSFNGDCREAMEFYQKCFGADLFLLPYSEAPAGLATRTSETKDRVMHSTLTKGPLTILMGADTLPGMPFERGSQASVMLRCESTQEIDSLFSALAENGRITMPLQETFWSPRFGMLTDKFGIEWMFNLCLPPPA